MAEEKQIEKICKTCLYWGDCLNEINDEYNQCFNKDKLTYMTDVGETPPTDGLATYHEWDDKVFTGFKFGCVHWQERRARMIK